MTEQTYLPTTNYNMTKRLILTERLTQGDPLSMVLYGITLFPLEEWLRVADLGLFPPFYANDVELNGSAQ